MGSKAPFASDRQGVEDLLDAIAAHRASLGDELEQRRHRRNRHLTRLIAIGELSRRLDNFLGGESWQALDARIAAGELSPFAAAFELLASGELFASGNK